MIKRRLVNNKRGQFMILFAFGVVIIMITLASLLANTSLSYLSFSKKEFREVTTQVNLNFRRTLALSLAGVSTELDFKASVRLYNEFMKLEDYPEARNVGYEFVSNWQNSTVMGYPTQGLNLTTSIPTFECRWDSFQGYSMVSANMTLDILNYGLYGWEDNANVELNLTILDLKETDGNLTSFYFNLQKENSDPVSGLTEPLVKILFQEGRGIFKEANPSWIELTYFGSGNYLATFVTNRSIISDSFDLLKTNIANLSDTDFKNATYKNSLLNKVDEVIGNYSASFLTEAYTQLSTEIRPKLDPADEESWVVEDADTLLILFLIDDVLSQLVPKIKMILQDARGIIVGSTATLLALGDDTTGPKTSNVIANPNPTNGLNLITLTAKIDDLTTGWSNIASAEYFVETIGDNGSGTLMTATDGSFDSPTEEVRAEINVATWGLGNFTLYVHGKDASGNWGNLSSTELKIIETPMMHVDAIDMSLETSGWWRIRTRAVAVVTIVDGGANPVESATVYGHWSGATSGDDWGVTDINGQFSFRSDWVRGGGTFTFTVDDIVLSGWVYDQSSNEETSDDITG